MTDAESTLSAVITIGDETTTIEIIGRHDGVHSIPRGTMSLHRAHVTNDPPLPENLTNAIGDMMDHLDDALRDVPSLGDAASIVLCGPTAEAVAAVEFGGAWASPFALGRDAAEDVFRTLATEPLGQRLLNPGLPPALAETIPAGCCAVVAIVRALQLDGVTVIASAVPEPAGHTPIGRAAVTT